MKRFGYETTLNQLGIEKDVIVNGEIKYELIPQWVRGNDFLKLFLPYLIIIGDSREQNDWVEKACAYYGIQFQKAVKDKKLKTENLKEGDYSFALIFGNRTFDYCGIMAVERKGAVSEFFNNCTGYNKQNKTTDRERIEREMGRFESKEYKKVLLMLEFGEKLTDLIDMQFEYYNHWGYRERKNTGYVMYSAVMSWKQPNNHNLSVIQSSSHGKLFWQMLQEMFYFFRQELRLECQEKGILEN